MGYRGDGRTRVRTHAFAGVYMSGLTLLLG